MRPDHIRRLIASFSFVALAGVAMLLASPVRADAHPQSVAFWKISFADGEARSQILVSLLDFGWTAAELEAMSHTGELPEARLRLLASELLPHFAVYEGDAGAPARVLDVAILSSTTLEVHAVHRLTGDARAAVLRATFHELTDDTHRVIARVERHGTSEPLVFHAGAPQHQLSHDAASTSGAWFAPAAALTSTEGGGRASGLRAMLLLGIEHILTGYDHLVFLCCLLVPGGTWRSRVAIVTAFTVAHSVTLALAAMQIVTPPERFIEAAIAVSIAYVAIENLLFEGRGTRWPTAFGFGLVHGFGFAAMLNVLDLPLGQWLSSLVAFNLGVEIGQLAVVAVALPVIAVITRRSWHRRLVQCTSVFVLGLAAFWIVERLR